MENFDRENIDELLEIRQIREYFPLSKFCTIRYVYYEKHNFENGRLQNNSGITGC